MANFSSLDLQNFSMDPITQFAELNTTINYQTLIPCSSTCVPFSVHHQAPEFPGKSPENSTGIFLPSNQNQPMISVPCVTSKDDEFSIVSNTESKKRKATVDVPENSGSETPSSSVQFSRTGIIPGENSSRRGKKSNNSEREEDKGREVVHIRARRGQATDNHSLAERTMGMATMLDEMINYVRSLQNQVEFLSMNLAAASSFYDFNSENDAMDSIQRAKAREAVEMGRQVRDCDAVLQSSWTL